MYKIYIGEKPIILASAEESKQFDSKDLRNLLVAYQGKATYLLRYVDNLEKNSPKYDSIIFYAQDFDQMLADFFSLYKVVEAAGGLVFNSKGEVLAIYRLGCWDLPKGKIEKGERPPHAAVREVQEETGLQQIELKQLLLETYHTYIDPRKDRRVLKRTHWFLMETQESTLTPQTEEDIELATWIDIAELKAKTPIYKNILEVLKSI